MDILYARCAGLDIHRDTIVACVRLTEAGRVVRFVETFATTTTELERLSEWLAGHGVTCIAMEATGVYWKPVWAVLAGDFELVLANAHHVKAVPGRKTDVNDATWLADLLAHGLIRPSFVPPMAVQALRELTRTRKQLTREKASHVQRIDKLLQAANLKLGSVLSDIMGQSGRAILDALAAGAVDPGRLADLVRPRARASRTQLIEAPRGRLADHQRLLLGLHLAQADAITAAIARIDAEVNARLEPFRGTVTRLSRMPGLSGVSASVILSEIGFDMSRFPTPAHLVSWAGLCPRNDESAGQRRSTRLRHGAPWLKTLLEQAAWPAGDGQLSQRPVLSPAGAVRGQEGDRGGGRVHAHRHPRHARPGCRLSRSRVRSLRAHQQGALGRPPHENAQAARLHRRPHANEPHRACSMLVDGNARRAEPA